MRWHKRPMALGCIATVVLVGSATAATAVWAEDGQAQKAGSPGYAMCGAASRVDSPRGDLAGIQIETGDIGLHERFFLQVLHAEEVQRIDHPQVDFLRGYCYRNVLIMVRQDIRTPRPTGWVQVNFSVADVGTLQQELEHALREPAIAQLDDAERTKVVRLRFKPDVPRNNCRVARLEVNGPEGFMIGFDQIKEGSCKTDNKLTQGNDREDRRPHH